MCVDSEVFAVEVVDQGKVAQNSSVPSQQNYAVK